MEALNAVLPIFVDYLGRYEGDTGHIESHHDVLRELLDRGVQEKRFMPNGELTVGRGKIVLKDTYAQRTAAKFSLLDVKEPVAFVSKDQTTGSGFSRVVVFIEERAGHFNGNKLYHAFQCLDSDPTELVEMIKNTIMLPSSSLDGSVASRRNSMDSNWMMGSIIGGVGGTDSVRSATIRRSALPPVVYGTTSRQQQPMPVAVSSPIVSGSQKRPVSMPVSSFNTLETSAIMGHGKPSFLYATSEDSVQKNTILLNYCIDDIERFCADLRAIKNKNETLGGQKAGDNDLRATDFIGVFQKIKLALNLLAFLQGHIQDPSAPELLHHLFPPLALLVDECFEMFNEDLVKDVINPLPTTKAVRMLSKHLTPKEILVWRALGDYWQKPRPKWDGDVVPYRPIFHDSWSPGIVHLPDDDNDIKDDSAALTAKSILNRSKSSSSEKSQDSRKKVLNSSVSDTSEDNYESTHTGGIGSYDEFRDELLLKKGAQIALVTQSRDGQTRRELSVNKGEYLEVLNDDKKWWKCKNYLGEKGFVPHTLLKAIIVTDHFSYLPESSGVKRSSWKSKTKNFYSPPLYSSGEDDSTTEEVEEEEVHLRHRRLRHHHSPASPSSPAPTAGVPPPAPPPMPTKDTYPRIKSHIDETEPRRSSSNQNGQSIRSASSTSTPMQLELKSVLELYREKEKHLEIMTTPDIYITQKSTPHEVNKWFKAKHFSQRVMDQFSGMHGDKLFSLSRKELIAAFGKDEGARLDSQITISRNTANYKTARSSELKDILEKARKRSEKQRRMENYGREELPSEDEQDV